MQKKQRQRKIINLHYIIHQQQQKFKEINNYSL